MGTKKKVGKERLDKFYHMAKEQGYRSRAAFKLIQLAKKHDFFSSAQVCVDLCAAPGGWMQVAQKNMPVASKIIGIDLAPIKAIPGCTAIQADITTQRCRNILKKEMSGLNADVFLHDGAPNTGTSWTYDAYVQNELVLHSFKLATEFLRPGGHFITKVFRSADYNSLLWVFQQLFHRVEATKPQASRNVSAEIFVMCLGYKNPSYIDPKFFDPMHVFAQEEESAKRANAAANELDDEESTQHKKKSGGLTEALKGVGKKWRGGYEEGDDYRVITGTQFINAADPARLMIQAHRIDLDSETSLEAKRLRNHASTTPEIVELASDIRVLGKRDLSTLLTWRYKYIKALRELEKQRRAEATVGSDSEEEDGEEAAAASSSEEEEVEEEAEEQKGSISKLARAAAKGTDADHELQQVLETQRRDEKRADKKRREKEKKHKHRQMMSMGGFVGGENEDPELFRATPDVLRALAGEDDALAKAVAKAKADGKDINDLTRLEILAGSDAEWTDEDGSDEEDSEDELMTEEEKRFLAMERSVNDLYATQKETQKAKKAEHRAAQKAKETRREKVTAEWAQEIQNFDKYIDEQTERVLAERAKKAMDSSDEESSSETSSHGESEDEEMESDVDVSEDEAPAAGDISEDEDNGKITKRAKRSASVAGSTAASTASGLSVTAQRWLENPLFKGVSTEEDEDDAVFSNELRDDQLPQMPLTEKQKNKLKREKAKARQEKKAAKKARREAAAGMATTTDVDQNALTVVSGPSSFVDAEKPSDVGKFEVVPRTVNAPAYSDDESDSESESESEAEEVPEHLKKPDNWEELAAIQAFGQMMIHKRTRMDLIDGAYNRYCFEQDSEDIPSWFLEDDETHSQPQLPFTKEAARELRRKYQDIAARPIRKEQEALGRKKKKAEKKFDRAKKAAEAVNNDADMTEASKAASIRKIMRKASQKEEKKKVYAVGNKAGGARDGSSNNPYIKNAKTIVVDKRLKKDKKAVKRVAKRAKTGVKKRK